MLFHYPLPESVKHLALLFSSECQWGFWRSMKMLSYETKSLRIDQYRTRTKTALLQSTLKDIRRSAQTVRCCPVMLSTSQYVYYRGGSNQIRCLYLRESNTRDGDPPTVCVSWRQLKVTKTYWDVSNLSTKKLFKPYFTKKKPTYRRFALKFMRRTKTSITLFRRACFCEQKLTFALRAPLKRSYQNDRLSSLCFEAKEDISNRTFVRDT